MGSNQFCKISSLYVCLIQRKKTYVFLFLKFHKILAAFIFLRDSVSPVCGIFSHPKIIINLNLNMDEEHT